MKIEIIPKDCLLCDSCNKQLSNGEFIALEDQKWREGWLYCLKCDISEIPLIMDIKKGQDLSKTDLARPMEFQSW